MIGRSDAAATDEGTQKLPLANSSATRVMVKYPPEGGYAPGDTWELYVGPDYRTVEFIYHGALSVLAFRTTRRTPSIRG